MAPPQAANRKHSHDKHKAGKHVPQNESPAPAAQTPEAKGDSPAGSSTPKVLSSKVTSMKVRTDHGTHPAAPQLSKRCPRGNSCGVISWETASKMRSHFPQPSLRNAQFMQRRAKAEKLEDPAVGAAHREAAAHADKEVFQGPPLLVLVDGGRHPMLRFVAGRRSFGGMNAAMETWAAQQDKSYRRAVRYPLAPPRTAASLSPPADPSRAAAPCPGTRRAGALRRT